MEPGACLKENILYIGNELLARGGAPTPVDHMAPKLREEGYLVRTASKQKKQVFRLLEMLLSIIKNRKWADLVLIDTYSTRNFWYAVTCAHFCKFFGLPYFAVLHGGELGNRIRKDPKLSRFLFKNAVVNVAPSRFLLNDFKAQGIENITMIPNSLDIKHYTFKKREQVQPRLLWVRSFAEIYNPLLAIRVLEDLLVEFPGAELCMVGPEKDASLEECRDYVRSRGLPVKFTGKLPKEEWISLAGDYDIFLNTTQVDNTPVSLIEAMALGLPVVSTNVGGIPYLLADEHTGILVPPEDVSQMTTAIKGLLKHPEKSAAISENARKKVEAFDWEVVKKDWATLIESFASFP